MEHLSENIYFEPNSGTMIQFRSRDRKDIGRVAHHTILSGDRPIMYWGADNDLPMYREITLMDNNIMGELINTKRSIILGNGLQPYREEINDKNERIKVPILIPNEVSDWMEKSEFHDLALKPGARELFFHANIFTEFLEDRSGKGSIASAKTLLCRNTRAVKKNKQGIIPTYLHSSAWNLKQRDLEEYTAKPISLPNYKLNTNATKSVYHVGDDLFNDGYYYHPAYWGGKEWIELSNVIPKFHKANISHGYNIRFHIEIPDGYFLNKTELRRAKDKNNESEIDKCHQEAKGRRQVFIDKMNAYLAGEKNAGRAIYTGYRFDAKFGKEYPGIRITPITADLKDESMLKLFEKSNQANISSQGIHPTLANIETQGKLSSGSEMRNAFNFYVAVKAPFYRDILLKPWKEIWRLNGWKAKYPDMKWGFEDTTLSKLDDDKSGTTQAKPLNTEG